MPAKLNEREYRDFILAVVPTEEEQSEERKIVKGYASTFNQPYTLWEDDEFVVQEQVDSKAFDNADRFRMPAMLLADGTMGQMMEPVSLDFAEGEKVEKPWATNGTKMARPHNVVNSLFLKPEILEQENFARYERYRKIEETEATMMTLRRSKSAEVALCRSLSISSLTSASFSIYISLPGMYASG